MRAHQARQEAARVELIAAVAQLQRTLSRTLAATLVVLEAFGPEVSARAQADDHEQTPAAANPGAPGA